MPTIRLYNDVRRVFLDMDGFNLIATAVRPTAGQSRASIFPWYPRFVQQQSFWVLESMTNAALLGGLADLVGSSRQVLARMLAHLAEVEERRLHLDLGYASMFAYCVKRLGLSEDEACRRIDVARLAHKHPSLYPRLASGQVSLSVAALLKHHINDRNEDTLLELVSGSTVERAREQLAAHFPRPDAPSTIRKLPEPGSSAARASSASAAARKSGATSASTNEPLFASQGHRASSALGSITVPDASAPMQPPAASQAVGNAPMTPRATTHQIIEPLSKGRYRIQLTADTTLKGKLELARDLMRHTQPDGDFAPILDRALDLLIEQIMKRRFGARTSQRVAVDQKLGMDRGLAPRHSCASCVAARASEMPDVSEPTNVCGIASDQGLPKGSRACTREPASTSPVRQHPAPERRKQPPRPEAHAASILATAVAFKTNGGEFEPHQKSQSTTIPRATRRLVAERDGLRCTWQGPDGTRCNARAWLENDHTCPRGCGGGASPTNIRLLCRSHNRRAAEKAYGRRHIDASIARARHQRSHAAGNPPGGDAPMD